MSRGGHGPTVEWRTAVRPVTTQALEGDLRVALERDDAGLVRDLGKLLDQLDVVFRPPPVSMISAALWYAERGLRVFPLMPGTKVPYKGGHGVDDATTTDKVELIEWFDGSPGCNLAIATGHLVDVIDVDGPVGVESMVRELFTPGDEGLWSGPVVIGTVSTPRAGGSHLYIAAVPGHGNRAHMLPGIDYRGLGGYVVAPPSTVAGGSYRWVRPITLEVTA